MMLLKSFRLLGAAVMCGLLIGGLQWAGIARAAGLDDFEPGAFEHQGRKLLYRLLKPQDYDPQQQYPLVLFLHGAGERGDDGASILASCWPRSVRAARNGPRSSGAPRSTPCPPNRRRQWT